LVMRREADLARVHLRKEAGDLRADVRHGGDQRLSSALAPGAPA
jgi:hypothetical protein